MKSCTLKSLRQNIRGSELYLFQAHSITFPIRNRTWRKEMRQTPPTLCSLHEPVSPESLHSLIKGFLDLNFLLDPYIWPPYLLKNISTRFNLSFKICGLSPILILSLSLQLRKVVEKQLLINPLFSFLSSTASVIFNKADYGIASTNCGRIFNSCTVLWMILKIRRDGDLWSRNLLKIVFSCFPSLQLYTWID